MRSRGCADPFGRSRRTYVQRWRLFAPEASRLGVGAMYRLPLAIGAIRVGVRDLYRDRAGELGQEQLVDALVYADTAPVS